MKPPIKIQTLPDKNKTEFENFVAFTRKLLRVSKKDLDNKTNQAHVKQQVLKDDAE